MGLIVFIQLVTCAFMTGLIWTVQLLVYPSFADVSSEIFINFHERHSSRITFLVGPVMLLEAASAVMLLKNFSSDILIKVNLVLLVLVWLSTAVLSVPAHTKLGLGFDSQVIRRLVVTNWPRTFLWTARLFILGMIILK